MNDRLRFLGPEAPEAHSGYCGFRAGPKSDRPDPACLAEATWHGIVLTDDGAGLVTLLSCCDGHRAAMELTADCVHAFGTACPIPEAHVWWDGPPGTSGCFVDWDMGALAADQVPVLLEPLRDALGDPAGLPDRHMRRGLVQGV